MATGLILGPVTALFVELTDGLPFDLSFVLVVGLRATLFFGLVATLFFGLVALLARRLLAKRGAEPVEEVRWSWSQLTAGQAGGRRGALRGGLFLGLASVLLGILDTVVGLSGEDVTLTLAGVLADALTFGLAGGLVGLVGGLRAAVHSGLVIGSPVALFFWLIGDPAVFPGGQADRRAVRGAGLWGGRGADPWAGLWACRWVGQGAER
ncbi:MAG: hypothetical protein ACRDZO_19010 [Egibacteraceae bacterium]